MKYGAVRRGAIDNVALDKLTDRWARELGAPDTKGALVVRMQRNSQAFAAGIRPGDIIVAFNGRPVEDPSQLYRLVADTRIGSTAVLTIIREGRKTELKVPIAAASPGR